MSDYGGMTLKRTLALLAAAAGLFMFSLPAAALQESDVIWSGAAGSGSSTSYVVFDFGPDAFAFKYSYDGAKSGYDMLTALATEVSGLNLQYSFFGSETFLGSVAYPPYPATGGGTIWWSYWWSTDGLSWGFAGSGASSRVLTDGSWDGWSMVPDFDSWASEPSTPVVPEPVTGIVLGMGLVTLVFRKKLKTGSGH